MTAEPGAQIHHWYLSAACRDRGLSHSAWQGEACTAPEQPLPEQEPAPLCDCGHPEHDHSEEECYACECEGFAIPETPPGHVCETYYCPTAGEVESACHGGFDVCCSAPEKHTPADAPRLDQPLRRPPYAVAYSVLGHLYEVALPGDATVEAVDGALVIRHGLGPVAGICAVNPMSMEG